MSARYLTLAQAAAHVATPVESIRYWIHVGKLQAFKPGRQVLIRATDLEALIEASEVGAQRVAKAKLARAIKKGRAA